MIRAKLRSHTVRGICRLVAVGGLLCVAHVSGTLHAEAPEGFFASPGAGERLSPGSRVEIRWSSDCERENERQADEAELVLSLDGGITFPVRVSTEISPCASRFSWLVPALASSHARLGLRTGDEEREGTEEVRLVGPPFVILSDPEGASESLYARGSEWSTAQPPAPLHAEDLLDTTVADATPRLVVEDHSADASQSPQSPAVFMRRIAVRAPATASAPLPIRTRPLASRPGAPTPLRQ